MVSRRNFLTITVIILVVLFMFQLSGVAKEIWNDFGVNQYAEETKTNLHSDSTYSLGATEDNRDKDYVIYIGSTEDSAEGATVKQWCIYTKRRLIESTTLQELSIDYEYPPEVVLLDSSYMEWSEDISIIQNMVNEGIHFIFCNLPSVEVIENNDSLKNILGITFVSAPKVTLQGIKLFAGFLLGGEVNYNAEKAEDEKYQDMDLEIPWYSVTTGTKTYMVGILKKIQADKVQNEYLPAIIWRNSIGDSRVFVVNGDYLSTNTGIGILDAMMAEMNEYEIYPIANAQSIVALNFPVMSNENDNEMKQRYSRSSKSVFRDIVWPGMITLTTRMNSKITCMMNPQLNYKDNNDPDAEELMYYAKLISEQKGEVGLSESQNTNLLFKDKLKADEEFLNSNLPDYKFTSLYADNIAVEDIVNHLDSSILQNIRTILVGYKEHDTLAFYATDDVLVLGATIDGFSHTFSEDLRVKSLETALGYSTIIADMQRVFYPKEDIDEWEHLHYDLTRFTTTYWRGFTAFEQTTLSESDMRMRELLAMDYSDSRSDDLITLKVKNLNDKGWFLLRVHGENITEISGGTYTKVENDVYLIFTKQNTVRIKVINNGKPHYSY